MKASNFPYQGGRTLLHFAVDEETKEVNEGQELLDKKCPPRYREIVKFLLNIENFDVNAQDDKLATPLHYACKGKIELMEELLKSDRIDVNAKDKDGLTPLLSVISKSSSVLERTKLLLQHKRIDVNATATITGISGTTPLHLAYRMEKAEIAEGLLKVKGIDVNAVDGQGMTPCDYMRGQKRRASQKANAWFKSLASASKRRCIKKWHTVRNLHFLSKYSTLISKENCLSFLGQKLVKMLWFWTF